MCVDPAGMDGGGGRDGGIMPPADAAGLRDAVPSDAFLDDPPPEMCLEDGTRVADPTPPDPECDPERRREGCRCEEIGATGPCWPGLRIHRDRGLCQDGVATCEAFDEFSGVWSPCRGAVLPAPGVERGPAACNCFSAGRWEIDNLSPCFVDYGARGVYAVSTFIGGGGSSMCPTSPSSTPPPSPQPGTNWSTNRLTVDCEGRFELCYTLKAGDAAAPTPADCTVARVCTEAWYMTRDVTQELPVLPAWTGTDPACARRFRDSGGYGEMSVLGLSIECDPVDDGMGGEYVFNRVNYCPIDCPAGGGGRPECMGCMMGGSGDF
jgi:hypothetical protein